MARAWRGRRLGLKISTLHIMISQQKQQKKVCLVTVGATASFDTLINAVLSDSFLGKLQQQQYTDLVLQHGKNGEHLVSKHETLPWLQHGITLRAFDINPKGLMEEMRWAKGAEIRAKGVVISHAGVWDSSANISDLW